MLSDRFYTRASMAIGDAGLRAVGKLNVPIYRATRGRLFGRVGELPVLLLTTTGRRSGAARTVPVGYMREGESFVVIGSNAGNERMPAWALNLQAHKDAEVEVRGQRHEVCARVAAEPERGELWRAINERYSGFDDYEVRTSRKILVFVLDPR
jgi:F420H(2)-dependent quinone reductase